MMSSHTKRRFLGLLGTSLLAAGVALLLVVGWTLWGTNVREAREQDRLEASFAEVMEMPPPSATPDTATTPASSVAAPVHDRTRPALGEPVARLEIPRIGLEKVVVMGTTPEALEKGPGLFRTAELPGEEGNVTIAGHRVSNGAPFREIDELRPGDEIRVTIAAGSYSYLVRETRIISPKERTVLDDTPGERLLTLVSCHPEHSTRQRIIVIAVLPA